MSEPETKKKEAPDTWTKSSVLKTARRILGPFARVWERNGRVDIGYDVHGKKVVLGGGVDYADAVQDVFVRPIERRLRADKLNEEYLEQRKAEAEARLAEAPPTVQGSVTVADSTEGGSDVSDVK